MLPMLKSHRKIAPMILTALLFLCGAQTAYSSHQTPHQAISYRADLGQDLDGDKKPETATIHQGEYVYQVNIHFTTGRPKLRLTTHVTQGLAGLSFQSTDINNDSKGDLVIISATSIRPVAVWVNEGRARFQKLAVLYYGGVGRYSGPSLNHRSADQPEPIGNDFVDPLPQVTPAFEYFSVTDNSAALHPLESDQHPFDTMLRQIPPRGPPAAART